MEHSDIKKLVQNYSSISSGKIEKIIEYIVRSENIRLENDCHLIIDYDEGGCVKEKDTPDDKYQLHIGTKPIDEIKEQKELLQYGRITITPEEETKLLQDEKKEFIELILQIFHELRHLEQLYNIIERPILTQDTLRITQEKILNDAFPGLINIYNYEHCRLELDAMIASLYKTVLFFKEMGINITQDEIFEVMKQKELINLNYDLNKFGKSFESAIKYFEYLYHSNNDITNFEKSLTLLTEEEQKYFYEQCQYLYHEYKSTDDIDKKWELLVSMALTMKPELYDKYPLIHNIESKKK